MSLIQRIKSILGLNGSVRIDEDGPVAVTVEHDPEPATETPVEVPTDPASEHDGPITEISGIGPSYAERLADAGIETVGELASADATTVANQTELSEKRITGWIESAKDLASNG